MGSSVLARLALRGARTLGIEQFERGHDRGASSGETRIIRQAYFEDAAYVPLLFRAYELWRDIEERANEEIVRLCGVLLCGAPTAESITGATYAARTYGVPVEHLSTAGLRARFPALRVRDAEVAVLEPGGGVVFPERAVAAYQRIAEACGAEMRFENGVRSWRSSGTGVSVTLSDGTVVNAGSLVLALGPWSEREFARAGVPLEVQRNVQVWFGPETSAYRAPAFPAFFLERESMPAPLYGFPDFGGGLKAAFHAHGERTEAAALNRDVDPARDVEPLARSLDEWLKGGAGTFLRGKACMYALTPDRHFVIDRHPHCGNVVLCGGFSGHGFKFASVVGEICADLALSGTTAHDIAFLSARRFGRPVAERRA